MIVSSLFDPHFAIFIVSRCESSSGIERVRRDPSRGPAGTENPNKNDNKGVRGDPLRDLPEWLEEFTENLVDDSVPEHRDAPSSSRESSSEPRAKVVSAKHRGKGTSEAGVHLRRSIDSRAKTS